MWIFDHTLLQITLRTFLVYCAVLVGMRLCCKREVGQMTPFDLVLLLLIANAVQNAMTGPDTSVTGGIVAAATLFAGNFLVRRLAWSSGAARKWIEGIPTLLIHDGKILQVHLDKEQITQGELLQALREHSVEKIEEVHLAMLEIDGSISVLKKDELPAVQRPHHHIRFVRKG